MEYINIKKLIDIIRKESRQYANTKERVANVLDEILKFTYDNYQVKGEYLTSVDLSEYLNGKLNTDGSNIEDIEAWKLVLDFYSKNESDLRYKSIDYVPNWSEISGKPSAFNPSAHNHSMGDVSGLNDQINLILTDIGDINEDYANLQQEVDDVIQTLDDKLDISTYNYFKGTPSINTFPYYGASGMLTYNSGFYYSGGNFGFGITGIPVEKIDVNGNVKADGYVFNTSSINTYQLGKIYWDAEERTFVFGLENGVNAQLGEDNKVGKAYSNIVNGQLVMYRTSQGGHTIFEPADFEILVDRPDTLIGMATQDILANTFGYVTVSGRVNDINTSEFADGDTLYLDSSNTITNVQPTGSYFIIGRVDRAHATQGRVSIKTYFHKQLNVLDINDLETELYNATSTKQDVLNETNLGQIIDTQLSIKMTPSNDDEIVMLDSITGEAVTAKYNSFEKPLKVITVTGNITLSDIHNNAILHIINTCTITVPIGMTTNFSCNCYVKGAFMATFASGGVILNAPNGLYLKADKMAVLYNNDINNFNLLGELSTT